MGAVTANCCYDGDCMNRQEIRPETVAAARSRAAFLELIEDSAGMGYARDRTIKISSIGRRREKDLNLTTLTVTVETKKFGVTDIPVILGMSVLHSFGDSDETIVELTTSNRTTVVPPSLQAQRCFFGRSRRGRGLVGECWFVLGWYVLAILGCVLAQFC